MLSKIIIGTFLSLIFTCTSCSTSLRNKEISNIDEIYSINEEILKESISTSKCLNTNLIEASSISIEYVLFDTLSFINPNTPIFFRHNLIDTNTGELNDNTDKPSSILASDYYPKYEFDEIYFQYPNLKAYSDKNNGFPVLSVSPIYRQDSTLLIVSRFSGVEFNLESYIESEFILCSDGSYVLKRVIDKFRCIQVSKENYTPCK